MSWKRTVILLIILCLILAFYSRRIPKTAPRFNRNQFSFQNESPNKTVLESVKHADVLSFDLENSLQKNGNFSFSRDNYGFWWLRKPVLYPAESIIVDGFVSLLRLSERVREINAKGLSLNDFGLDNPKMTVCVFSSALASSKSLKIGSPGVVSRGGAYAKWDDEDKIFIVTDNVLKVYDKTLYELRRKQVLGFPESDIREIRFKGGRYDSLFKHEKNHWYYKGQEEILVAPDKMRGLIDQMNGLFVKEFIDGVSWRDEEYGFNAPFFEIKITLDGRKQTLVIGNQVKQKDAYYGFLPALFDEVKIFGVDPAFFRSDAVFLMARGKVEKISEAFGEIIEK